MDLGLQGKVAIVTGGGSNIGRAISFMLAREGAKTIIVDIDETQANKVVGQICALGGQAMAVNADVTSIASVEAMVKHVLRSQGQIDILIDNVGWDSPQLFVETTPDFWEKVIALNYRSHLNCLKTVLPHMIARGYGRIVSISSDAGRAGEFREAVYAGCKAGVIALSKSIAREVGRYGITVNVVCPGVTVPESEEEISGASMWGPAEGIRQFFTPEAQEKAARNYPLRRLGRAQDMANAVVFLASDAASYITGQTLSVSGGYTMI